MLTLHSLKPISIQIEEVIAGSSNDYDALVNKMAIEKHGKEIEVKKDKYRILQQFYE